MPSLRHAVGAQTGDTVTTLTATGIVPAGSNRYGLVKVAYFQFLSISSVVWGGVNITTNLIKAMYHDGSGRKNLAWFFYLNPPAASADVVVTLAGASFDFGVIVEAWDGVHQTTPYGSLTFTTDEFPTDTYPPSIAVASVADEVVTDSIYYWSADGSLFLTVGAGQTSIQELEGASLNGFAFGSSYAPGATSVAMDWTHNRPASAFQQWCAYAISLKPAAAAGGGAVLDADTDLGLEASARSATAPLLGGGFG